MKTLLLTLGTALLLSGCNQTAPATSTPAAAVPAAAPAASASTEAPAPATPPAEVAAAPVTPAPAPAGTAPALAAIETMKLAFRFKPVPDADNPGHTRISAHLLVQGSKPQDIDLGKFASKPDVVDAAKAKLAGFPKDMLMGFRSYNAGAGRSEDLAVLFADGRYVRVVQRRVEETAAEPGIFKTSREITLPANTVVVAADSK